MACMTGNYTHGIDGKGRLFIPAKLREELGDVFYMMVGTDKCLTLYPQESWDRFCERITGLDSVQSDMLNIILGNTVRCETDAQGRIAIPQYLRDYAGLGKNVVISGHIDTAKIWDADEWNSRLTSLTPENVSALMASIGI